MATLGYILYTELMVGAGHPTASDTLNRALRQLLTQSGLSPDVDALTLYGMVPQTILFSADGSFDIGAVAASRPRDLFVKRHATFGGNVNCAQFDNGNSGSTLTIDWNNGNAQRVTLTAATVTLTLTNAKAGGNYVLECVQDGSGSRLVTWAAGGGTAVIWPGGTTPTLTTTISRADVFSFFYDGVPGTPKYCGQTVGLNYAV
jgi:hypothetical protein